MSHNKDVFEDNLCLLTMSFGPFTLIIFIDISEFISVCYLSCLVFFLLAFSR